MADNRLVLWVWRPDELNWWIGTLFMIGAALFALGSALYLAGTTHELTLDAVFFGGSLFFISAAYCQFHQALNVVGPPRRVWVGLPPARIGYWATLFQFIGTVMFNFNTFDAFFDLGWAERELLVWTPNITGSVLFMISGSMAMFDYCRAPWCWKFRNPGWWMNFINFLGCVAFLISALLAFAMPGPVSDLMAIWSTRFTLVGALCFFAGAHLMWRQLMKRVGSPG